MDDKAIESANTTSAALEFWRRKLAGELPECHFAPDYMRSTSIPPKYKQISFTIDGTAATEIEKLGAESRDKLFVFLATVIAALLSKYNRGDEVIFGTTPPSTASHETQRISPPLALRLPADRKASLTQLLAQTSATITEAFANEISTTDALWTILGNEQSDQRCPIFDVALRLEDHNQPLDLKAYPVDLIFEFDTTAHNSRCSIKYRSDLYEAERVELISSHLLIVLEAATNQKHTAIEEIEILTRNERELILTTFNDNSVDFSTNRTFHGLFEEQVPLGADETAVVFGGESLSYNSLNQKANRLAGKLIQAGLRKGEFVAILQQRNCNFLTAMLAVFKAGGAYVPVDPTYPEDRIQYMLSDCQARFAITESDVLDEKFHLFSQPEWLEILVVQNEQLNVSALFPGGAPFSIVGPDDLKLMSVENPGLIINSDDRAYMIYTSGSTGRPKGAICRHDGALNHLFGELHGLGISEAFSFLQSAAASSDISVWQFLAPILYGGTTIIVDHETVTDPELLFDVIKSQDLSLVELVPVVLRALVDYLSNMAPSQRALPALKCMMATGDALPVDLVNRWFEIFPNIPIANTYGPTEASDDVTLFVAKEPLDKDRKIVPIGRPMPNLSIFILDESLKPTPFAVPGEICVSGIGVGEGYWNQPDKTAAAFVPNPIESASGNVIYRTGDLGRWLGDGSVEFLGRIDQQVKIRGFRIEPGEVQAAMLTHAKVNEAKVVAKHNLIGNSRLVAYYVAETGQVISAKELREFLSETLADYMIPSAFIALETMPLTPVGKIDQNALPEIAEFDIERSRHYVAPSSETEIVLEKIWSEILGISEIGIHDDFVELGGESILSINIAAQAKLAGIRIRPAELFLHPTISELAKVWLERSEKEGASSSDENTTLRDSREICPTPFSISRLDENALQKLRTRFPEAEDAYPLSPTQSGIYLQSLLSGKKSGTYIEQIIFTLTCDFELSSFEASWESVIADFPVLRSGINRRGTPEPLQVVLSEAPFSVEYHDWSDKPEGVQDAEFDALVKADRVRGFDLTKPPLMRVTVVSMRDDRHRVFWTYHHIILDGWSEPLVIEHALSYYKTIREGSTPKRVESPKYSRFISWLGRQDLEESERFWRSQLESFRHPTSIPASLPLPEKQSNLSHGWVEVSLKPEETRLCHDTARRLRTTPSTIFQVAWCLVLSLYADTDDILYGTAVSGRQIDLEGVEDVIGLFIATLPVHVQINRDQSFEDLFHKLQKITVEIRQFEHFPPARMQQLVGIETDSQPMFDTVFVMANYPGNDLENNSGAGVDISEVEYITMPHYPITLFVVPEDRIKARIVFDRGRYSADTIMHLLENFQRILLTMLEDTTQSVKGLLNSIIVDS